MRQRFDRYVPIARARPDLPAWLDAVVARTVAVKPRARFGDAIEFAHELEAGSRRAPPPALRGPPFYERDPLLVWKLA